VTPGELEDRATRLLGAFAACDLEAVAAACAEDVIVYGTDRGERWWDRATLLEALEPMRALRLRAEWTLRPDVGAGWVAGVAAYEGATLARTEVRVTMVFSGGRLAHGHFSGELP
jgi:hypothetical protein